MHLLNVYTRQLQEFFGDDIPEYAILSHTWGEDEVLFQDLSTPAHKKKRGYEKIEGCCQQAISDDFEFIWVDTCCIDKRSSAELTEAINSMFRWYGEAKVCYVYLSDVLGGEGSAESISAFSNSRWFTRGWTLQELIAPAALTFFDRTWLKMFHVDKKYLYLGSYAGMIERITGIRAWYHYTYERIGGERSLMKVPVATKLSWASRRHTTRAEDMAYCLLGLLDVNMPLLYGEGEKAFLRLQEEFLKKHHDQTILCWGFAMGYDEIHEIGRSFDPSCLAPTPLLFRGFRDVTIKVYHDGESTERMGWAVTPRGLHIELPMVQVDHQNAVFLGLTNYYCYNKKIGRLVIPLHRYGPQDLFRCIPTCRPFLLSLARKRFSLSEPGQHWETAYLDNESPSRTSEELIIDIAALYGRGFALDSVYPPASALGEYRMQCSKQIPYLTPMHTIFVLHRKRRDTLYLRVTCSRRLIRKPWDKRVLMYKTMILSCPYKIRRSAIEVWDAGRKAWARSFQDPPQLDWQETATIHGENRVEQISSKWTFRSDFGIDAGVYNFEGVLEIKVVDGDEFRYSTDED